MQKISPSLRFFLTLAKIQTVVSRKFDSRLNGLGLNEFIILYNLSLSPDERLRRIDLAEKVGLTASGVTRILLPMEKIGLIKRETDSQDARVSYVLLAPGGKSKLKEGLERAELLSEEAVPVEKISEIKKAAELLDALGKNISWG